MKFFKDSFSALDPQPGDGGGGKTSEGGGGGTPEGGGGTPGGGSGAGTPSTGDDGKGKRGGNKWSWGVRTVLLPLSVLGFIIFFILAVLPSQEITTIVDGEETEITLVDYVRSLHGRISELEQTVKPAGGGSVMVLSVSDAKILLSLIEGASDDDKDGVLNSGDVCPDTAGKTIIMGCSGAQIWETCSGGVSPSGASFTRSGCGTISGTLTCDWDTSSSSWANCHE